MSIANQITGFSIEVFDKSHFLQGKLIWRRSLLKNIETLCVIKGHQLIVGSDETKPFKIFEMHEAHSVISKDVKSFELVTKDEIYFFTAESKDKRDTWIKALISSIKESKQALGNHVPFPAFGIQASIDLENEETGLIAEVVTQFDKTFTTKSINRSNSSTGNNATPNSKNFHRQLSEQAGCTNNNPINKASTNSPAPVAPLNNFYLKRLNNAQVKPIVHSPDKLVNNQQISSNTHQASKPKYSPNLNSTEKPNAFSANLESQKISSATKSPVDSQLCEDEPVVVRRRNYQKPVLADNFNQKPGSVDKSYSGNSALYQLKENLRQLEMLANEEDFGAGNNNQNNDAIDVSIKNGKTPEVNLTRDTNNGYLDERLSGATAVGRVKLQKRKKYRLRLCVDTTDLRSWIVH